MKPLYTISKDRDGAGRQEQQREECLFRPV